MVAMKENVVVYTIQMDTEEVKQKEECHAIVELFQKEFEKEGMEKEAKIMNRGGFSYRETERNSYYTEFKIFITTKKKVL